MGDAGFEVNNKFPIPAEFQHAIKYQPNGDTRSDEEILQTLNVFQPVTSERNVWAYWDSGLMSMPAWQKRNVCDWVRLCGSRWTIRVLDNQPESPNYALKHVPADSVPACFRERTHYGPFVGQHSADFLRGTALYHHGGVWSDVGQILMMNFERICWSQLEDPNSPYEVCAPWMAATIIGNWFIAARKGNIFIKKWHDIFMALWEGRSTHEGVTRHPLLANTGLDFDSTADYNDRFDFQFKVPVRTASDYVGQIFAWTRLVMCEGSESDPFSGLEYWRKHVLLYDALEENLAAELRLGWADMGMKLFNALKTSTDAKNKDTTEYKDAYDVVWRVLSKSSTQKVARGGKMFVGLNLGSLWDMPENREADREPGTFAELLRYGAANFVQTRPSLLYVEPLLPPTTLKKGALEP